jgi:DNA repair protein RadC
VGLDFTYLELKKDHPLYSDQEVLTGKAAVKLVGEYIAKQNREYGVLIPMDVKGRPINVSIQSIGGLNKSVVHTTEVMRHLLMCNAYGFIYMHNHPSGVLKVTKDDVQLTDMLMKEAKILGIIMFDHVVVGKTEEGISYYSMREHHKITLFDYVKKLKYEKKESKLEFSNFVLDTRIDANKEKALGFTICKNESEYLAFLNNGVAEHS